MNGGEEVGGGGGEDMEEDGKEEMMVVEARGRDKTVLMWGYLPGVSPQRSPLLHPVAVRMPDSPAGDRWKDVSGGGCGFAMAISESGNLFTWGSTDDMGQSYVTSGKHEETPEVFDLPTKVPIVKAAAGWAHCVAVTDTGALLTFGWGLYGQCGQGSTDDELSPTCVSSLLGVEIQGVAAGLWHTVCTSVDGGVYSFGGNQFGQLGTGSDQAELGLGDSIDRNIPAVVPIENLQPKNVSCGWWHTLVLSESPT
ncbi:E3 ubiquitin-protein ligase [Musa troglodytarum]|uniref:E3 ubiquitin-protein ligase n=1 Tax=Musa troglodytarum TaxID=320322 RepID=A0A9E7ELG5_9LILI|nr:E3 ubiquitin-protein ligase [Musa troglodytarum]